MVVCLSNILPPSLQSYQHISLCTHLSQTFYATPEEMKDSSQGSTPQIQIISAVSASHLSPLISNSCLIIPHTQVLIPLRLTWLPREILCMCSHSQVCFFAMQSRLLVTVGNPSAPCKAHIPLTNKEILLTVGNLWPLGLIITAHWKASSHRLFISYNTLPRV